MIKTFSGSNSFMLQHELKSIVDGFLSEHGDMALERVDGEEAEYQRIVEAVQGLPFLAAKKLVVLSRPGTQKQFAESFNDLIKTIPDSNEVIIVEPKLDKRSSYFKQLKKSTEFREFAELDERGLSAWLVDTAKDSGGTLSGADARYMIERAGANQQLLSNELSKLILFNPQITRQTIDELVESTPNSTVFQLLDSAFAGNHKRTMELYEEQRSNGAVPLEIVGMLAWQLHILAIVKAAGDRAPGAIAKEAGINPYVVSKTANIAKRLSLGETKQLVNDLVRLDVRLKSEAIDPDDALQNFLLNLSK